MASREQLLVSGAKLPRRWLVAMSPRPVRQGRVLPKPGRPYVRGGGLPQDAWPH